MSFKFTSHSLFLHPFDLGLDLLIPNFDQLGIFLPVECQLHIPALNLRIHLLSHLLQPLASLSKDLGSELKILGPGQEGGVLGPDGLETGVDLVFRGPLILVVFLYLCLIKRDFRVQLLDLEVEGLLSWEHAGLGEFELAEIGLEAGSF